MPHQIDELISKIKELEEEMEAEFEKKRKAFHFIVVDKRGYGEDKQRLFAVSILTSCVFPERQGGVIIVPPPLPPVVEFEEEPYYYQNGYHYYYRDNAWFYSNSRNGPWEPLPRDRYPRETRFKHRGEGRDEDRGQGRGHDRGDDERDRY